jgi:hypothetical protein
MRRAVKRSSILTITFLVGIGAMTACSSSKSGGNSIETVLTKTAQNQTTTIGIEKTETSKTLDKSPARENEDAPSVKKIERKDLFGSYVHRGRQGETSYEFVLTLKDKNIALYKSDYTGGAGENSGVWSFDEKKNLVTVKMKLEAEFDEGLVMILEAVNGNLEVIEKPADEDPIYGTGTIFKKL